MNSKHMVRQVEKKDIPRLAITLARAFDKDPIMSWCIREDQKRSMAMRYCFEYMLSGSVKFGEVTCTEDLKACAIWLPPGKWLGIPSFIETLFQLPDFIKWMGLDRINRWMTMIDLEAKYRPKIPHFYLAFLGVEPEKQGHGLGSALLENKLRKIDSIQLPAYLESSNIRNTPLYKRYGFKITGELNLPKGPTMWAMWRETALRT